MSFREEHDLHKRRFGRNLGLGLVLAAFVALVFGLTVVKVTTDDFTMQPSSEARALMKLNGNKQDRGVSWSQSS